MEKNNEHTWNFSRTCSEDRRWIQNVRAIFYTGTCKYISLLLTFKIKLLFNFVESHEEKF
jgi:hypothetical protein